MSNEQQFSGKRALITGAGRGIGREIAIALGEGGADCILAARSSSELEEVAERVREHGRQAEIVVTDLADLEAVDALAERGIAAGGVDILISNAAASPAPAPLADAAVEAFRSTMAVNVLATLRLVQKLAPGMVARPGSNVVVVSSIRGLGGTPYGGLYGASKAALNQMVKTLACELGPQGVRVNAILPGPVLTKMTTDFLPDNKALFDFYGDVAPIKGWTMAEDMVGPALFLAGPNARKVHGHLLVVDGGLSAINYDAIEPPASLLG